MSPVVVYDPLPPLQVTLTSTSIMVWEAGSAVTAEDPTDT
jgi:hypothetical protein